MSDKPELKFDTLNDHIKSSIECNRLIKEMEDTGLGWLAKITGFKKLVKILDEHIAKVRGEK